MSKPVFRFRRNKQKTFRKSLAIKSGLNSVKTCGNITTVFINKHFAVESALTIKITHEISSRRYYIAVKNVHNITSKYYRVQTIDNTVSSDNITN